MIYSILRRCMRKLLTQIKVVVLCQSHLSSSFVCFSVTTNVFETIYTRQIHSARMRAKQTSLTFSVMNYVLISCYLSVKHKQTEYDPLPWLPMCCHFLLTNRSWAWRISALKGDLSWHSNPLSLVKVLFIHQVVLVWLNVSGEDEVNVWYMESSVCLKI